MTIRELFVYLGFDVDTSGAKEMDNSIDSVKKHQESMFSSFLKSQVIYDAGKKIISGAFNFVKDSVIGATAEVERYRVTLGTMIGDQEKANKIIHDLDYSPVSDFYGTANAIGGLQSLVTYGLGAEEASDALSRLGDIAQGDSEAFNSMAQNLGQIFATGKASSMDLKQFANRGFDVVGELARIEGKSREEIEKAGVGYTEVKKALDSLTNAGGKYEGMLQKQMDTLGGVLKQFDSFKAATAEGIGNAINEPLKDLLKTILEIARAGQEAFVEKFAGALKIIIHWIHQVVISFEIIKMRIDDSGEKFNGLKNLVKSAFSAIGKVVEKLIPILTDVIFIIITLASTIGNFLAPVFTIVGKIIEDLLLRFGKWVSIIDKFLPLIAGLATGIAFLTAVIKAQEIATKASAIASKISAGATALMTKAQGALNAVLALNPIFLIIAGIMALIAVLIVLYKKSEKFRNFIDSLWAKIKEFCAGVIELIKSFVEGIIEFFRNLIAGVINIWQELGNFLSSLWGGLIGIISVAVSNISNNIINKFNALKNFLVDFWNALKGGPRAFVEFISNIFINMIENIKEKLFGFIDVAKNTIGKVKDFFGGAWDSAVNFVSGGKKEKSSNKMMDSTIGNTSTYYGNQSSSNVINAPTTMNISVPQGTSEEQQKAIAEQIQFAYNNQLAYAINSSRSNIPSPEKRRY